MKLMTDTCTLTHDRDETLVAYLYDDIDAAARTAFEAHLTSCAACRDELESLHGVRRRIALWAPPEANLVVARPPSARSQQSSRLRSSGESPSYGVARQGAEGVSGAVVSFNRQPIAQSARPAARQSWLPDVPAWAQAAAAILILGAAAGIANLDVRYDKDGLTVRTGWSPPVTTRVESANPRADAVSRAELVALEERLKNEVRALQTSAHADSDAAPARTALDADQLRRVRTLLDESEKRQQNELALRVGELLRDVNAQRQADLVRIDRSLGLVENNLGVEVLKQRERVNYLMRVNQKQ